MVDDSSSETFPTSVNPESHRRKSSLSRSREWHKLGLSDVRIPGHSANSQPCISILPVHARDVGAPGERVGAE